MSIAAALRTLALAVAASLTLAGTADAASGKVERKPGYHPGYVQPHGNQGHSRIAPSASYDAAAGTRRNFTSLPRDTRQEGFNRSRKLDWFGYR